MFGKLLKFDFKSMAKFYFIFYIAYFCLSFLIIQQGVKSSLLQDYYSFSTLGYLGSFSFLAIIIGAVSLFFYTILFLKNSLFDQWSYQTHTLPVSITKILWSKFITLGLYSLLTLILLTLFTILNISIAVNDYSLFSKWFTMVSNTILPHIHSYIWLPFGSFKEINLIILCMALVNSTIVPWRNYIVSVIIYILISFILSIISGAIFGAFLDSGTIYNTINMATGIFNLVVGMLFYLINIWIFKHKLEL